MSALPPLLLPEGITQRYVDLTGVATCGLKIFLLEAGDPTNPLILLFHGYPELAYTWRKMILPLASKGYHVVAADSRGLPRTSHDFGASAASACALTRPDLFRAAAFMSHVPTGPQALPPLDQVSSKTESRKDDSAEEEFPRDPDVHTSLAQRNPPVKHYKWYNSTPTAAHEWGNPPQGLRAFLRGYVHLKSHAWKGHGDIGRLTGWTAEQLTRMPPYYVMPISSTMPGMVEQNMRTEDEDATKRFVTNDELDVYVSEFERTGFQGMLNWYRSSTSPQSLDTVMALFAGRKFEVPTTYISGVSDWGNYQRPGALEGFETGRTASDYRGTRIFDGAGHWPQTEIPDVVCEEVLKFLDGR